MTPLRWPGTADYLVGLAQSVLTGDGLHPVLGNIVPSSGFAAGLSLALKKAWTENLRWTFNTDARYAAGGSWSSEGVFRAFSRTLRSDLSLDVKHTSLAELTFFGLGPHSELSRASSFSLAATRARAVGRYSVTKSISAGVEVGGLWVGQSPGRRSPSIENVFTATEAPGLNASPRYLTYGALVNWRYPADPTSYGYSAELVLTARRYEELSGLPYSFTQGFLALYQEYGFGVPGTLSMAARLVESRTGQSQSVPFYLQPTLGGAGIDNTDSLASYRDYRFRAPNTLMARMQYDVEVWWLFGAFGFADVGQVAISNRDLNLKGMPHSTGLGLTIRLGGVPVARIYYAWGGQEGSQKASRGDTSALSGRLGLGLQGIF